MTTSLSTIKNEILPSAIHEAEKTSHVLAGRSASCVSTATKAFLWTTTALTVAALAAQVFGILMPALFASIPFLPFIIVGVLAITALSCALSALMINKIASQKEAEKNLFSLKSKLQEAQSAITLAVTEEKHDAEVQTENSIHITQVAAPAPGMPLYKLVPETPKPTAIVTEAATYMSLLPTLEVDSSAEGSSVAGLDSSNPEQAELLKNFTAAFARIQAGSTPLVSA